MMRGKGITTTSHSLPATGLTRSCSAWYFDLAFMYENMRRSRSNSNRVIWFDMSYPLAGLNKDNYKK